MSLSEMVEGHIETGCEMALQMRDGEMRQQTQTETPSYISTTQLGRETLHVGGDLPSCIMPPKDNFDTLPRLLLVLTVAQH